MYTPPLKENKNCYATLSQRTILMELAQSKILADDFFLTGGTALAVFYLNHRISNDAIFEDPPTVAYQIEEAFHFLQENSSLFPPLLVKFDEKDFYHFYQQLIEWLYRKVS